MSYDVYIYRSEVRAESESGRELDDIEHPPLASADVERFLGRLAAYGYQPEGRTANREFVRNVGECPVQVLVSRAEIAFSIPYWDGADRAIAEALQDASELADQDGWSVYDPQRGEWW